MKICVAGLGLIGGSMAKAIKKHTDEIVYGLDINKETIASALAQETIDGELTAEQLGCCDMVILGLYPQATIDFVNENKNNFKSGSIVIDTCGIKQSVVEAAEAALDGTGVSFLGCHPMAGREFWGFAYALDNLFDRASFIMTPTENTPPEVIEKVRELALRIGFAGCVTATPREHDEVIAFTSQLAHVVSSAYIKSPSLFKQAGFSAGSFKDLTRVAKLNEDMWTSLFLLNREPLLFELDHIIGALTDYRDAIKDGDADRLHALLKEGRELKELSIRNDVKKA
ncbi:MAG: prephenate dehydrogenase [Ruminococcus sp.]|nr:prephenate dehydrogenase [Ruminococcus sp.]